MSDKYHIFLRSIDVRPECGNRKIDKVNGIFVDASGLSNNPIRFFQESWKCIKKNYRCQNCESLFKRKHKL